MKTKKIVLFCCAVQLLFCFACIFARAETDLKAEVDKTKVSEGELVTYKLIITSVQEKLPKPQLPLFSGFLVVSQAQSSTVSFVKGKNKFVLVYVYMLKPKTPGRFSIEPARITIGGKTYETLGFEIEVAPSETPPIPKEEGIPPRKRLPLQEGQPEVTL